MTLLIVDDEYYSVENLKKKLNWSLLGFDSVITAYSAKQAEDQLASQPVDLMIADIEMPHGSGLDLLAWMRERLYETECIFLTCHAKFDYAANAIKLGSLDYLLKPVDKESLLNSVNKAVDRINSRKKKEEESREAKYWKRSETNRQMIFWRRVIMGNIAPEINSMKEVLYEEHLPENIVREEYFCTFLSCSGGSGQDGWRPELFGNSLCNILYEAIRIRDTAPVIIAFSSRSYFILTSCGNSTKNDDVLKLRDGIDRALHACSHFLPGQFRFYYIDSACDAESIPENFRTLQNAMTEDVTAVNCVNRIPLPSLQKSQDENDNIVQYAKTYIKGHLAEDLSRSSIAEVVHLSPDYLSHLFREKTGKTITAYISEKRIQKAEKMLADSSCSISEIAIACGFQNISYFSRQFKAYTGKTPQEYSRMLKA